MRPAAKSPSHKGGLTQTSRVRWERLSVPTDAKALRTALHFSLAFLAVLFVGQAVKMPSSQDLSDSGLEVHRLPFGARLVEAFAAVVSVGLVTLVYTLLIQRGSLMATTSLYPRRPIEVNAGRLLDATWPVSIDEPDPDRACTPSVGKSQPTTTIQLYYVGKLQDEQNTLVAKGRTQSSAKLKGEEKRHPIWLASGSPLTKNVVQIMVWEWVSLWLMVLLAISTLTFNGFFTGHLNLDSFPRLTVIMIYIAAFVTHFFYIWIVCLEFFKLVFGGSSWSLLERSKFVVGETHMLHGREIGSTFTFRSIDKANDDYVPTTFDAALGRIPDPRSPPPSVLSTPTLASATPDADASTGFDALARQNELSLAIKTINSAQKTERETATEASRLALDRVTANSMVMMAVTISSGFASWTSGQFTSETPNNTSTTQIGSLALLASLSLGAAAMFSSAMQLNIMKSAFRSIVSLKEIKINGLALDFYRKTRSGSAFNSKIANLKPVAFTEKGGIQLAGVELADFFAANRDRGWAGILGMICLGPGHAMLPSQNDHDRKSKEVDFDFVAPLRGGTVTLTTRTTDRHVAKEGRDENVDPIIACYVPHERERNRGTEPC